MLLGRQGSNNNRRANRSSRGRGQDSMSRGASNSFSKLKLDFSISKGPTAVRESTNTPPSRTRGRAIYKKPDSKDATAGTASTPNAFEKERLENAAKRTQREKGAMVIERGGRGGKGSFSKPPSPPTPPYVATSSVFGGSAPATFNPFAPKASSPLSMHDSTTNSSSFGAPSKPEATNVFGKPTTTYFGASSLKDATTSSFNNPSTNANPFEAPSKPDAGTNTFGSFSFGTPSTAYTTSSQNDKLNSAVNSFGPPLNPTATLKASGAFGAATSSPWSKPSFGSFGGQSTPNSFSEAATNGNQISDAPAQSKPSLFGITNGSFSGLPSNTTNSFGSLEKTSTSPFGATKTPFGASNGTPSPTGGFTQPSTNGIHSKSSPFATAKPAVISTPPLLYKTPSSSGPPTAIRPAANSLAAKVEQQLKKDRIAPPQMPTYDLMYERQLLSVPEILRHVQEYKAYQEKVRSSLMKAGLIDDPHKPKSLKDAIDFKGTCEDMCPQLEKIERLSEGRVDVAEKGAQADGTPTRHAVMDKMVKILARSSAGQSAPLPSEVRTTAALRRTVDYLMKDVLNESNISKVHGFLWNRTRAIRRDFVFHSFMSPPELVDQVYCLETIARFHTIALHLMSKPENYSETFDTHQEFEQLGNTMISLMQAYGDCKANGVSCPNEAEFRAYLVVIQRKSNPGLLEMVHSWGWDLFEAKEVKIALAMAEALGNTWDTYGPLKPTAPTDLAQNAFSRFFDIVEDKNTSYTMACFAEIWFNDAREAIIRTILASYRKQKYQAKDWTVPVLNKYLKFDDENDIIPWCEARDVVLEEADDGSTYLSIEPGNVLNHIEGKQYHSHPHVERKRGSHSLQHVLYNTVYEGAGGGSSQSEYGEEDGLFVKQAHPLPRSISDTKPICFGPSPGEGFDQNSSLTNKFPLSTDENRTKPASLFDRIGTTKTSDVPHGFPSGASQPVSQLNLTEPKPTSMFAPQPTTGAQSIFTRQAAATDNSTIPNGPMNGTSSFLPTQPANGPSSFFPNQQTNQGFSFLKPSTGTTPATKPPSLLIESSGNKAPPVTFFTPQNSTPTSMPSPFDIGTTNTAPAATPKHVSNFPQQQISNPPPPATVLNLPDSPKKPLPAFFGTPAPPISNQDLASGGSLSNSNTPKETHGAPIFQIAPATQQNPAVVSNSPPPPFDRFSGLTDWFALGTEGIIEQFTNFHVENVLRTAFLQFEREECARINKEAEESAQAEADMFRYRSLVTKYGYLWREQARIKWLKRRGREARKNRRDMAESYRASKAAESAAIVENFRASTSKQRKGSLESIFSLPGRSDGAYDTNGESKELVKADTKSPHKRQRSQQSKRSKISQSSTASKHERGKSENPLRGSLISDQSYLQGGSRIHLMSARNIRDEQHRTQLSGVQTDYFRLKARGISTLHDGTPLANSAAQNMLKTKRSFDGFIRPATPQQSREQSTPKSVPAKAGIPEINGYFGDEGENIEALKARARAIMSERKNSGQKRSYDDEDEELFARAKRIREQMEEGENYYKKELERNSESRSTS
ncbi:uncharacterized protein RSE6_13496 [Rhynchosporium secalis]|uniref:SAC3/GANP/THP3 conserved domain-containing protein n=1 Tax=Rhynchosporium secalis TaxID=38038 RepID=A0A1E1MT06_RHYSE|nr:uncharacterized protein RSE6_13496 [Rhynchosporium secalis]